MPLEYIQVNIAIPTGAAVEPIKDLQARVMR